MGFILSAGGAEFRGRMAIPDQRALELAGGPDVRISIVPTAAVPDNNHLGAGRNGMIWFQGLGATHVAVLPLIDKVSAKAPEVVAALRHSQMVYLLGGFPYYLGQTLFASPAWEAMLSAYTEGAVIAGSSAGAMVLCEFYYDPTAKKVEKGLGLITGACIIPHHDTFGKGWVYRLKRLLPDTVLIGIDEETGILNDGPNGIWQIYGKGGVTAYKGTWMERFTSRKPFDLFSKTAKL